MTYFAIICSTKNFKRIGGIRGINHLRYKARVMLHMGAGHSNILHKLFGYDIFCKNLQRKKDLCKFGGIRGINHLR